MGYSFKGKQLCTVKLARRLYPGFQRYNLDSIIERHNLSCSARHRALGDTEAIYNFYQQALRERGEGKMVSAIERIMKKPSIPISISQSKLDKIPENPGVYVFRDKENIPLYIGKSVNLRDRVLSHFSSDYLTQTDAKLAREAHDVEIFETAGELGALLKESSLVKELQPIYNKQLRRTDKMTAVMEQERDGYKSIEILQLDQLNLEGIGGLLGIFRSQKAAKEFIRNLGKENKLCDKYLGLEKTKGACFAYQLNCCKGACIQEESRLSYNIRFSQAVAKYKIKTWPFRGPVIIKEQGIEELEGFIVDKWCLLGKANGVIPNIEDLNYSFDYDTYKILRKFLLRNNMKSNQSVSDFVPTNYF